MGTSKEQIKRWLTEAQKSGASHVIVVCDTYDWDDYPVPVTQGELSQKLDYYRNASMQKIMEVYNLSMDLDEQLAEHRAWNL